MAGVAVLLGAGARVDEPMRPYLRLLEFIVHGLRQEAAIRNSEDRDGVDVETMFDAIETLANRTGLRLWFDGKVVCTSTVLTPPVALPSLTAA